MSGLPENEMTKTCTICDKDLPSFYFANNHSECKVCHLKTPRAKRIAHSRTYCLTVKHDGKTSIIIPYEPDGNKAWVRGYDIRLARKLAGIRTTYDMAWFCGWSQTMQVKYEVLTRHKIKMTAIWKMTRVCNGETNRL